jgi:hypothetical protein
VALLDSDLPPKEKSADRLHDEAQTITPAESETTSRVLSVITFHLKKLRDELASVPFLGNQSLLAHLENLPYLNFGKSYLPTLSSYPS